MPEQSAHHFILLRGLTRESAHWGNFIPQLQAAFPNAKLSPLDLPGAGSYFHKDSPNTIPGILEQVRAQAYGVLTGPATLIGMSLGGMIAWEWMLRYPEEAESAVLINISLGGINPFYQRLRWQCYGRLMTAALEGHIEMRESALLALLSNRIDDYRKIAANWTAIQKARPVSTRTALRQLLAAASYRPGDSKPEPPVLMLNSLGDKLVAPQCSKVIAQKWQLELRTHPWGGHDLTLDGDEWVAAKINEWLKT
ncbi:MAG: alpha/beta hydrolase [Methylococcales bacterium]|nr:alpha/beta hydrolase [Methylococcales bacterium]